MKICEKCDKTFSDGSILCPFCGIPLDGKIEVIVEENEIKSKKIKRGEEHTKQSTDTTSK